MAYAYRNRREPDNLTRAVEDTVTREEVLQEDICTEVKEDSGERKVVGGTVYEDIMRVDRNSDWDWVSKDFRPRRGGTEAGREAGVDTSVEEILNSHQVQAVIEEMCVETGKKKEDYLQLGRDILYDMKHEQRLHWVRWTGFVLSKLVRRLYRAVWVNPEGAALLRSVDCPVILLPSHRSYVDFLIISFVSFHYNLHLPVIAAGMDFQNMSGVATLLRNCGAFFIRRTFGSDRLYWALIRQYIQTELVIGRRPLEFFLEGTRSRSGKSLPPKSGLLSLAIEPFIKGEVFDTALVPITINYDKVLEETLFAFENLGVPKPPESTSGLVKALQVLDGDYGHIHVTLGRPLHLSTVIPRSPASPPCARTWAGRLAPRLLREQQKAAVLTVFSVLAAVLAAWPGTRHTHQQARDRVKEVMGVLNQRGAKVDTSGDFQKDIDEAVKVHRDLIARDKNGVYLIEDWGKQQNGESGKQQPTSSDQNYQELKTAQDSINQRVDVDAAECDKTQTDTIPVIAKKTDKGVIQSNREEEKCEGTVSQCVPHLRLRLYSNALVSVLVSPALVVISSCLAPPTLQHLEHHVTFLQEMLLAEFPNLEVDFAGEMEFLVRLGVLQTDKETAVRVVDKNISNFFIRILYPFIKQYQMFFNFISEAKELYEKKILLRKIQRSSNWSPFHHPLHHHLQNLATYSLALEFSLTKKICLKIEKDGVEVISVDKKASLFYSQALTELVSALHLQDKSINNQIKMSKL